MHDETGYPICYECKHCDTTPMGPCILSYDCSHPSVMSTDIVTGARGMGDCAKQRNGDTGKCGIEGRLWEPRLSLFAKMKGWFEKT